MVATNAPEPGKQCNTSEASPIADGAIAGLFVFFTALSIDEASGEFGSDEAPTLAVLSGLTAGLFAASTIRGFANVGKCRRHQRELYDEAIAIEKRRVNSGGRRDAWELTRTAAKAARTGDCETVFALDKVLRRVDGEFHRGVFLRDVAIARCFTTEEIDVPPPSETATPPEMLPEPPGAQPSPETSPTQPPATTQPSSTTKPPATTP